jgi:hypothetical protein
MLPEGLGVACIYSAVLAASVQSLAFGAPRPQPLFVFYFLAVYLQPAPRTWTQLPSL